MSIRSNNNNKSHQCSIILRTWYQDRPEEISEEVYKGLVFDDMNEASAYLYYNSEDILGEFPVVEFCIRYVENDG